MKLSKLENNLLSIHVVVTRPQDQAKHLYERLMQAGFSILLCPSIKIVPTIPQMGTNDYHKNGSGSIAKSIVGSINIFTSTNAVYYAFDWLRHQNIPLHAQYWLAVGPATKTALQEYSNEEILTGETANSEGLLALPILQNISSKQILLFKGAEGRDLLENTLRDRGAKVSCIAVYHRELTTEPHDFGRLHELLASSQGETLVVLATSASSLINLFARVELSLHSVLLTTQVIAASSRIAQIANDLGFKKPALIAADSSDEAMLNELKKYYTLRI